MGQKYTCRGSTTASGDTPEKIHLFDGRFDTGYRVLSFRVAPSDIDFSTIRTFACKLATTDDLNRQRWDWSDQREVAWAYTTWDSNLGQAPASFPVLVDSETIIVEDLYFYSEEASIEATSGVNYFIELEKVDIPEWKGALSLARDAQSD
jgi:hypothetical protein